MSTDWDVYCLDCKVNLTCFNDANHAVDLMRALIRHAPAIAALTALQTDPSCYLRPVELSTAYGPVDARVFAEHLGHKLVPRNEYGSFDGECGVRFACGTCGQQEQCHLAKDHAGDHSREPPLLALLPHLEKDMKRGRACKALAESSDEQSAA